MAPSSNPSVWHARPPVALARLDGDLSVSSLLDAEECPRRWALARADYPNLWGRRGYPGRLWFAALRGRVVHASVAACADVIAGAGAASIREPSAVAALRQRGGYSGIIREAIDEVLKAEEANPRAARNRDPIERQLREGVPEMREETQARVVRLVLAPRPSRPLKAPSSGVGRPQRRARLEHGSHSEVDLRAAAMGWVGVPDLLTLSPNACEITDHKTGEPAGSHAFQVRVYALLWARDSERNPEGRLATRLVLAYRGGNTQVPPPDDAGLRALEDELRERRAAAMSAVAAATPRPSVECQRCSVRQLCSAYWEPGTQQQLAASSPPTAFADVQLRIQDRHGPASWEAIVESGRETLPSTRVVLRVQPGDAHLDGVVRPGTRLRVLGVHVAAPDAPGESIIATMGATGEAYVVDTR